MNNPVRMGPTWLPPVYHKIPTFTDVPIMANVPEEMLPVIISLHIWYQNTMAKKDSNKKEVFFN